MYHSFRPGQEWLDTEGRRIQAHGGSVIYVDGIYYFYGENKEKTDGIFPHARTDAGKNSYPAAQAE